MLRRLNIRDKLLLVLWGTSLLASVLAGGTALVFHRLSLARRATEAMEPYARLVAVGAESAVAFEDPVRAQEVLNGLSANPKIHQAELILESGRVLARFSQPANAPSHPLGAEHPGITLREDTADLETSLPHGARLRLVMELSQLDEGTQQALRWFAAAAVALVFITLGQTLVLRRTIVRPLAALTSAAEDIRLQADSQLSVPAEGTDEMARLGRSFNAMLEAVRARERALEALTTFQRAILDSPASGIVSTTPDGKITSINQAAERLLGYSADELVGKQTPLLWHLAEEVSALAARLAPTLDQPAPTGFDAITALARRGQPSEGEWRFLRKDGSQVPVHLSVTALKDEGGRLTGFVGHFSDLTERKQAEQQRLTHIHFLETMDRVSSAIARTDDLDTMLRDVLDVALSAIHCDGALVLYPCNPEAPVVRVVMARTVPHHPPLNPVGSELPMEEAIAEGQRRILASQGPVVYPASEDGPLPPGARERFHFTRVLAMALRPKTGEPWQLMVRGRDDGGSWSAADQRLFQEMARRLADGLTTLLAHRDLRESTAKLEEAQRIAHLGHWERNFVTGHMELAAEASRIFGLSPSAGPVDLSEWNRRWLRLIHPDDREASERALADALSGAAGYDIDYRVVRPGGEVCYVHSQATVTRDEAGRPRRMGGVVQDITERVRAEAEVRRLNQRLEQRVAERTAQLEVSNQELEAFAYSVSHDLRAPLRHINGFTLLLAKRLEPSPDPQVAHFMSAIVDASRRMEQLIEDLLSFSRMGRQEMSRHPVDLTALVRGLISELEPEAKGRVIHWKVGALPTVKGDQAMLRAVLSNLMLNAIKFTRTRPEAEIEVGAKESAREDEVFVRDNGVGFDMKYAGKLFGVFQRLHAVTEFEGTGIGLANVRRIVSRHGGRAWAEGAVGQGATFHFSLPRHGPDEG